MATYRGFVKSIQVRDDGWVEFVLQAVHAGNTTEIFFIRDLDGDVDVAHKRLAHLSLLRDALARILPVEVEYQADNKLGNVVEDLTVYPRPSIDGRWGTRRIEGTIIGLSIFEFSPMYDTTPYKDEADLTSIILLTDTGTIEHILLDLQRPDPMTAQAMLGLLREAFRTRRPVAVRVTDTFRSDQKARKAKETESDLPPGYIQACEWLTIPEETLDYLYAFIERLGQRYESYETAEAAALSHIKVVYTTVPGQTPEGDVSDNGAFDPQTSEAWVHMNSPLFARIEVALHERLQVKLGLKDAHIHEVELVGHLGSAARPIWIEVNRSLLRPEEATSLCQNVPTIQNPVAEDFNQIPISVSWRGHAYFNEGIWRFVIRSLAQHKLLVDGKTPCCNSVPSPYQSVTMTGNPDSASEFPPSPAPVVAVPPPTADIPEVIAPVPAAPVVEVSPPTAGFRTEQYTQCHAYLNGMHTVELILPNRTCSQPFRLLVYRIR